MKTADLSGNPLTVCLNRGELEGRAVGKQQVTKMAEDAATPKGLCLFVSAFTLRAGVPTGR